MRFLRACLFFSTLFIAGAFAQELTPRTTGSFGPLPIQTPNSNALYQQLRAADVSGQTSGVSNLVLKRQGGAFTFHSGSFHFVTAVNGKVTGAVFTGSGSFTVEPPIPGEKRILQIFTKGAAYKEDFSEAVFRFADKTYAEITAAAKPEEGAPAGNAKGLLDESKQQLKKKLNFNIALRLLQDVLSAEPGGYFFAMIKGKNYSDKTIFVIDPQGVTEPFSMAPEEVVLASWDDTKGGIWVAYHLPAEYSSGLATGSQENASANMLHHGIDAEIAKNGHLSGNTMTTFAAGHNGVRVLMLDLYSTLRVKNVVTSEGQSLDFIQEDKDDDPNFGVVLPRDLKKGEQFSFRTVYAGKEAIFSEGGGNYFPVARHNWYPNTDFGDYAKYDITMRVPKNMKIAATGKLLKEVKEGDWLHTEWQSEVEQAVGGFNFGSFKVQESKVGDYLIQGLANESSSGAVSMLANAAAESNEVALGTLSTTGLLKKAVAEGELAMQLYTDYFGPVPYKRLALSQQPACNFGQAWPGVIWLPMCYFWDTTVRNQLGLTDTRGYWTVVTPHEVAHQWFGHMVGFNSYRDQWMSEGFAEMAASMYIQAVYGQKEPQRFQKFWKDELELLTERNKEGFRAIDVGPLTMGYRLSTYKTGNIARRLIYPKGGFVLHMVRMMMWDSKTGDEAFKKMMKDFLTTHANRAVTTEDFKRTLEKHMVPEMNVNGDGKLDWFFNQYVYGTALPTYRFEQSVGKLADGTPTIKFKLHQSEVHDSFAMIVPVYIELANGKTVRLGRVLVRGNTTLEQEVPLKGLQQPPKRALINHNYDVLALGY